MPNFSHIIEYVGASGVRTTPTQERLKRPRPGDLVRIPEELQAYPFTQGEWARIDHVDGTDSQGRKSIGVCCHLGSAFLTENGDVSISGGPFASIPLADLEPEYTLGESPMWNWGDHSAGAAQGVDYMILRPVFRLLRHPDGRSNDVETKPNKRKLLHDAATDLLAACDAADTAFAVININRNHYELVPQAAEALREAWAAVNAAMAKARGTVDKFAEANS